MKRKLLKPIHEPVVEKRSPKKATKVVAKDKQSAANDKQVDTIAAAKTDLSNDLNEINLGVARNRKRKLRPPAYAHLKIERAIFHEPHPPQPPPPHPPPQDEPHEEELPQDEPPLEEEPLETGGNICFFSSDHD